MNILLVVIGGLLAAGGGLLGGWQSNRLGTERDQAAHAHEKDMAREAVRQDRLERAYTELGIYLSRYADWARSIYPFLGSVPAPDPMPPSEKWRIETLLMNHGSPEVRRLLEEWRERAGKIDDAGIVIKMAEQSSNDESPLHQDAHREKRALDDYRTAMQEADRAIRDQMHAELDAQVEIPAPAAPALVGRQRRSILGKRR